MAKHIKDLKDLRVLRWCACYRHSGPKGPEENKRRFFRSGNDGEGNPLACACGMRGPSPYGERGFSLSVARGPVPRDRWIARTMARETRSDARVETCAGPSPTMKGLSAAAAPGGAPPYCIETRRACLRRHQLHRDQEVSPTKRARESPLSKGINAETDL